MVISYALITIESSICLLETIGKRLKGITQHRLLLQFGEGENGVSDQYGFRISWSTLNAIHLLVTTANVAQATSRSLQKKACYPGQHSWNYFKVS